MVQVIENEAVIGGTVLALRPRPSPEWTDLHVDVERVEDGPDRPNLLGDRAGGQLTITAGTDEVARLGLAVGDRVEIDAELRGPGVVWSRPGGVRRG